MKPRTLLRSLSCQSSRSSFSLRAAVAPRAFADSATTAIRIRVRVATYIVEPSELSATLSGLPPTSPLSPSFHVDAPISRSAAVSITEMLSAVGIRNVQASPGRVQNHRGWVPIDLDAGGGLTGLARIDHRDGRVGPTRHIDFRLLSDDPRANATTPYGYIDWRSPIDGGRRE